MKNLFKNKKSLLTDKNHMISRFPSTCPDRSWRASGPVPNKVRNPKHIIIPSFKKFVGQQ